MNKWIPGPHEVVKEGLVVLGGVLLAALIISRLPGVKAFVQDNKLTVKDSAGLTLF
jgi:hypothetical protein